MRFPCDLARWAQPLLLLAAVLLAGCATVTVRSLPPGAEVVLVSPAGTSKLLGKTPYDAKLGDIGGGRNDGPVVVQVKKDGFFEQNFVIPPLYMGRLTIDASLKQVTTPAAAAAAAASSAMGYADINRLIRMTLLAERQIMQKQLAAALATALEIRKLNENITSSYEIEGAVTFIQADWQRSRVAWQRSLEINPENPDAAAMVRLIEQKLGVGNTAKK